MAGWFAMAIDFLDDPKIVELGEDHGPGGPLVIVALIAKGKQQRSAGEVRDGWRSLARRAFLTSGDQAREVIHQADANGVLELVSEDEREFVVRLTAWAKYQQQAQAAARQQAKRDRDTLEGDPEGPSAPGDPEGPGVTGRDESVTERDDGVTLSRANHDHDKDKSQNRPPSETLAMVARRLFVYWQGRCGHPHSKPTRERLGKAEARLREGYTEQQGRQAIDGAAVAAFVNERGKRFDDFELIFRSGSKLEDFMSRAAAHGNANGRRLTGTEMALEKTEALNRPRGSYRRDGAA